MYSENHYQENLTERRVRHFGGNDEGKEFVMSLYDDSMLDKMKKTYEVILKGDKRHKKNMETLRNLFKTEGLSLEETLIKYGGDRMQNVLRNDLDDLVSHLVDSPEIMLTKETKEKLFKEWEERLNRPHPSPPLTKLQ